MTTTTTDTTLAATPEEIEAFTHRFAADLAAVAHAATVVLGDKLGLYAALADLGPSTPEELATATGCDARYLREWLLAQAASGYADLDPSSGRFSPRRRPGRLPGRRHRADVPGRRHGRRLVDAPRRGRRPDRLHHRRGRRLAPAQPRPLHGHRAVLPPWLRRQPHLVVDPGDRRPRRRAAPRHQRGRRGLRPRLLHDPAGRGLPRVPLRRVRLPRGLDRGGPPARRRGRRGRPGDLRGGARRRLSGRRLRPGVHLRRPARHGRSRPRPPPTSAARSPPTASCCWSSRTPRTRPRTTSTWSGASSTRRRRSSARPPPGPRAVRARPASAPRPARRRCGRSCSTPASAPCGGPPRPRSTWCWRPVPDRAATEIGGYNASMIRRRQSTSAGLSASVVRPSRTTRASFAGHTRIDWPS